MSKSDIVITLFTVVYGLMLAELFLSLHKLIRARKTVKWHWLPLLAAWYLFLTILKNWWDLSPLQNGADSMNICLFIAYGHLLFLTFLLVSAALPDVIDKNGIELKTYYFNNHRYFWGLMSSVVILSIVINFVKRCHQLGPKDIFTFLAVSILPILTIALAISKRYRVHSTILILLVIGIIVEIIR
ncbi:hypothetical protein JW964_01250 [candidate division KSB1 bacterium]|nr:hypothetical protein [candidate division KSB1 bacterium]